MEARLVEFARLLRQNGVRVSPAEVADAARAAALLGVGDRAGLRAALRATLVKRAADVPLFDRLFALYFSAMGRLLDGVGRGLLAELGDGALEDEELRAAALALQELAPGLSPLARAALTGERGPVARLLEGAAREVDFAALVTSAQLGFYGRRLFAAAGGPGAARELSRLEEALRTRGLAPRALELVSDRLRRTLDALEEAARRYAELELRARLEARRQRSLAPAGFAALSRGELARAWSRAAPSAATWRWAACRRGSASGAAGPSARTWWCCATCRTRSGTCPGSCSSSSTRSRRSSRGCGASSSSPTSAR